MVVLDIERSGEGCREIMMKVRGVVGGKILICGISGRVWSERE